MSSLPDDRVAYWKEFNQRFVDDVYPTLFKPYGIAFNVAYSIWSECCLSNDCRIPGPPDTRIIHDEKEEWE